MIMIKPKNDNKKDNKKEMEKREKILGKELEKNNIKFPMHVSEFDKHTKFFMDYSLQNKTIYFMFSNKAGQGWLVISNGTENVSENVYASKDEVMDVISKKYIAEKIVNHIRSLCVDECVEDCIWDENKEGASWIDNEIYLATGLLQKMNNVKINNVYPSLDDCKTVEECQTRLTEFSINDLMFMIKFMEHGGTSNDEFFKLRDEKKSSDIKAWFEGSRSLTPV